MKSIILMPFLSFYLALVNWLVISMCPGIVLVDFDLSMLLILVISSLGIYAIIYTGWFPKTKYTLLGSLLLIFIFFLLVLSFFLVALYVKRVRK